MLLVCLGVLCVCILIYQKTFSNEVDWYNISKRQKLSEDFIREFKDRVDWSTICET
jgi:hypothetical protein